MYASPRGSPAAILAVSPPRIDTRACLKGVCLWRFCRRRNFVRQCWRVIVADSPLKTHLPGVLKGLNHGTSRGKAVLIYADWSIPVSPLFFTVRKAVAAGAGVVRTKAARRRVNEDSYGNVVRNLKGWLENFEIDSEF